VKSPLRYPGSKAAFSPLFFDITRKNHNTSETIVEPFAGSAAVSLYAIENNICKNVILVERDPLIYSFWKSTFDHTKLLIQRINKTEITIDSWRKLDELRHFDMPDPKLIVDLGFAGLFFNRTNFSGIIGSTPIGGLEQNSDNKINCRFNKKEIINSIEKIALFRKQVRVVFGNATVTINKLSQQNKNLFFFIDPPYFKQGPKLYRYSYTVADHLNLSNILINLKHPYFLTYDKHHVIEYLYRDQNIKGFENRYSTKIPKKGNELLISNRKFKQ
jgi:DNA adenine methylase